MTNNTSSLNIIKFKPKVSLNTNPSIPEINKITAENINEILNFINYNLFPVGSYYETSDTSFDPNVTWGGTWVKDSKGRVTVALDDSDADFNTISKTGGEKTHTLTVQEMPSHNHQREQTGRALFWDAGLPGMGGLTSGDIVQTSWNGNTTNTGGGQAHNNVQPFVVVVRWHRTV